MVSWKFLKGVSAVLRFVDFPKRTFTALGFWSRFPQRSARGGIPGMPFSWSFHLCWDSWTSSLRTFRV